MYKVYASKTNNDLAPDYNALVPYQYLERDEAAKQCIELFRKGYTIHKIVLPTGGEITRDRIEAALKIGMHSIRATIG